MRIWQQQDWPMFTWDNSVIEPRLREVRLKQGILLGKMASQSQNATEIMLDASFDPLLRAAITYL